jgi:hypothetical protein
MMTRSFALFGKISYEYILKTTDFLNLVIFLILKVVHSDDQLTQIGNHISSLCSINRQGFGQFERVQLTSYSITIQFKNIFSNLKCSSIHIDAFITNIQTNKFEQTIQVKPTGCFLQFNFFFSIEYSNQYFSYKSIIS